MCPDDVLLGVAVIGQALVACNDSLGAQSLHHPDSDFLHVHGMLLS
jgi:hypothetical protein